MFNLVIVILYLTELQPRNALNIVNNLSDKTQKIYIFDIFRNLLEPIGITTVGWRIAEIVKMILLMLRFKMYFDQKIYS